MWAGVAGQMVVAERGGWGRGAHARGEALARRPPLQVTRSLSTMSSISIPLKKLLLAI